MDKKTIVNEFVYVAHIVDHFFDILENEPVKTVELTKETNGYKLAAYTDKVKLSVIIFDATIADICANTLALNLGVSCKHF